MTTRKAYAAAAASALGAVLASIGPGLDGQAAAIVYAVLAALVALGVTWRVPNDTPPAHGEPDPVVAVLDTVPALLAAPITTLRRGEDAGH